MLELCCQYVMCVFHAQIANVGPIIYTIAEKLVGERNRLKCQSIGVGTIVTIGTLTCILLSQLWHKCSHVFGEEHSTALIALAFFLALVDCTSSVVFLPFLAAFPARYLSALYVGEGLSGLIPSALALIQFHSQVGTCGQNSSYTVPVGCNTTGEVDGVRFQPEVYFGLLAAITIACGLAFVFLRRQVGQSYSVADSRPVQKQDEEEEEPPLYDQPESVELSYLNANVVVGLNSACGTKRGDLRPFIILLCGLAWLNALGNGVLPAISSYAYFPYGQKAFLLTTVAGILSQPAAAFLYHWLPSQSRRLVAILVAVATGVASYIVFLASHCHRPLECETSGTAVVVGASFYNYTLEQLHDLYCFLELGTSKST